MDFIILLKKPIITHHAIPIWTISQTHAYTLYNYTNDLSLCDYSIMKCSRWFLKVSYTLYNNKKFLDISNLLLWLI
ncbi:hypothetical protein Pint_14203 [Pistacia integerrima]|uniref:Uncharacterized protein n=1 Tax=Pistacia integerrima TaxID=434235 RepID=A0ACC0YB01_9ROSI|nr:hypothetical protein Pint_14203 [Pistacia integerrima]